MKIILSLFLFISLHVAAQNKNNIDSLKNEINRATNDSLKAELLYQLSREYWDNNLDTSLKIANELLHFAQSTGQQIAEGNAYSSMGVVYWYKGDYQNALNFHKYALETREAAGYKEGISRSLYNIGLIYDDQGNFPMALEYYLRSLRVEEEINDKDGMAQSYNNIGLIYYSQKNFSEALKNLNQSVKMRLETNDKWGLSESYSNIGIVYHDMGDTAHALKNYERAFKLREEIDDREGLAISYTNFGDYYREQKNYLKAIANYNLAMMIDEELGYKKKIANMFPDLGEAYEMQGNSSKALVLQLQAVSIAKEVGANDVLEKAYRELSQSYARRGDFKNAYQYHTLYKQAADSLFNNSRVRSLTQLQMKYEFEKKEAVTKAEQEKKDAIAEADLKRNKQQKYFLFAGLFMAITFAYWDYRKKQRISQAKKMIEEEKKRSDELLLNILPSEVAEELKAKGSADAKQFDEVTVLFTDFKNFTNATERLTPQQLVNEINYCYSEFDKIISKCGIEKIKTIGDAYMCAGGLPVANKTNAEDCVRAALEIRDFMLKENALRKAEGKTFFQIRIGLHTGPVVAGIVGIKKFAYDIWGDTVNIASRMESSGEAGRVNISEATYERVKRKFNCEHRGKVEAKNKGVINMYFVENAL